MAVLGAQLVITLIMISVIQKLGPYYSLAKYFLCSTGLVRYLYPTDTELRQLANIPKDKPKKGGKHPMNGKSTGSNTFHIPRSLDVQLDTTKVSYFDVIHLRYFVEYQWLVDFSVYAGLVYVVTEVYQIWYPIKDEMNLSMIWCLLVLLFAIKLLFTLTVQYFKGEDSVGERSTCIVMGFIYLLISMMILIVDENTLELGLEEAYDSFNKSASVFLQSQGLSSTGPASKIVLKFFIALWCGILGAMFTFPGMRIARMHWDLIKHYSEYRVKKWLLNISFVLPFLLVILWIKPLTRHYLTVRIFSGKTEPLMSEYTFDILRILAVVVTMCLKLVLMPWYLQAYLNMAYHRAEEQKKEAGRITNTEFQKKIAAVFYYLCVVTVQYVAPVMMCLYFAFMYKSLGDYDWNWLLKVPQNVTNTTNTFEADVVLDAAVKTIDPFDESLDTVEAVTKSATDFHMTLEGFKAIFTTQVFRGLFGFSTWWCSFLYFATTSLGLIYQSYFTNV